jgi:tetratricopeptide (TPR) repeat protein
VVTRGECRRVAGRLAEAEADWQLALAAFDPDNDEERGLVIERLARSLLLRGDSERARDQARAAIVLLERVGHAIGLARTHTLFGLLELLLGRPAEAAAALTRGRATAAAAGLVHLERSAILNLIPALHQLGDYEQAMRLVDEGLALSPLFTSPNEAQAFIEARHVCRYIAGDIGGALAAWPDLVRHTEGAGDVHRQCSGWLVAAELPLCSATSTTAAPLLDRALAATAASEIKRLAVQTHAKAGLLALLRGDLAAATSELEAGQRIGDIAPDELSYLKTLELRLRRAGGQTVFAEERDTVSRSGATAEVWALLLAAADRLAARRKARLAGTEVESSDLPSSRAARCRRSTHWSCSPRCATPAASRPAGGRLAPARPAIWRARLRASLSRHPRERAIFARRHARWLSARAEPCRTPERDAPGGSKHRITCPPGGGGRVLGRVCNGRVTSVPAMATRRIRVDRLAFSLRVRPACADQPLAGRGVRPGRRAHRVHDAARAAAPPGDIAGPRSRRRRPALRDPIDPRRTFMSRLLSPSPDRPACTVASPASPCWRCERLRRRRRRWRRAARAEQRRPARRLQRAGQHRRRRRGRPLRRGGSSDADGDALTYSWEFSGNTVDKRGGGKQIAQAFATAGNVHGAPDGGRWPRRRRQRPRHARRHGRSRVGRRLVDTTIVVRDRPARPLADVAGRRTPAARPRITAADGRATLATPRGVAAVLRMSKAGYADQMKTIACPPPPRAATWKRRWRRASRP